MNKRAFAAIALLAMALLVVSYGVLAQEQLQNETIAQNETVKQEFLFVQNAQSGTLVPVEGEENLYTLTLIGVTPQTIAFSDRPERIVVQVPMQKFLDGMCFSPENPPNAAIEILEADEEEDVAVVELFDPIYDDSNSTLQYNASILEQANHSYAIFNERADMKLPETFGPTALFIDDCHDSKMGCYRDKYQYNECGLINIGCCWSYTHFNCVKCREYSNDCMNAFGSDCGYTDYGGCNVI